MAYVVYFDLGSWQAWDFVDWSSNPPTLYQKGINNYAVTTADQLKAAGLQSIFLSFGQMANITKILSGDFAECSKSDAFYMVYKNTDGILIEGMNLIQYFIQQLKGEGIEVVLSFGGATATREDFQLDFSGSSPSELAADFLTLVRDYDLDGIDFDLEDSAANMVDDNGAGNLAEFFKLIKKGIETTLTVQGALNLWGIEGSCFGQMFSQGVPFNEMFSSVNLMLYNGQYYIDAAPVYSWSLDTWIEQIATQAELSREEAAALIHIGFNSTLDYADPTVSAGEQYDIPAGDNAGQAAVYVLNSASKAAGQIFATPFFWAGKADYSVDPGGDFNSQFLNKDPFEEQFTEAMRCSRIGSRIQI
ncbi:MAG: glycosyl hydrolase family 18 protein [Simkaniaceae bacterium]|nr:glycosyl hydrolase family 18 protein [Simkaniaceae bacterium]